MKKIIIPFILVVLVIGFIASCAVEEGIAIEDRISDFIADVNARNYSTLYKHFHPTQTTNYENIKPATYWNSFFPSTETYTLSNLIAASTAVGKISSNGGLYSNDTITFLMAKDGDDYFIKSIKINSTPVVWSRVR